MAPLLLESVEQIIGLIEGWPFAILQLFLDNPDETSIISVSAFFMQTESLLIWLFSCMRLVELV